MKHSIFLIMEKNVEAILVKLFVVYFYRFELFYDKIQNRRTKLKS